MYQVFHESLMIGSYPMYVDRVVVMEPMQGKLASSQFDFG